MKRTKMAILMAATLTVGSLSGIVVQAAGDESPDPKSIAVSYDNGTVPSKDGSWGVSIPTKIVFSDQKSADSDPAIAGNGYTIPNLKVTLKALNGFDITKGNLVVKTKLTSENNFQVKFVSTLIPYDVTYTKTEDAGADATIKWDKTDLTGAKKPPTSLNLPDLKAGPTAKTETSGTATLQPTYLKTAPDPGTYSDRLTYSFTSTGSLTSA